MFVLLNVYQIMKLEKDLWKRMIRLSSYVNYLDKTKLELASIGY